MNMVTKRATGAILLASALAAGCASVPMASQDADKKAKSFIPPTGEVANLYIYRNETMGSAIKMPLLLDSAAIGDTGPHTYVFTTINPGKHTVTSKSEKDVTLDINAVSGQTYYVWQEVKVGVFAARSALHVEDEATGKKAVLDCKLIQ